MTETSDGPRPARESDHYRLGRQVKSLSFMVRDIEKRLASVEVAADNLRADVRVGRDVVMKRSARPLTKCSRDIAAGR